MDSYSIYYLVSDFSHSALSDSSILLIVVDWSFLWMTESYAFMFLMSSKFSVLSMYFKTKKIICFFKEAKAVLFVKCLSRFSWPVRRVKESKLGLCWTVPCSAVWTQQESEILSVLSFSSHGTVMSPSIPLILRLLIHSSAGCDGIFLRWYLAMRINLRQWVSRSARWWDPLFKNLG